MVSRRTRVASWIFRRDHPSRPNAMICCFFSSFKTFAMLREATYPPAAVNVLDVSSESMAAFQVFMYGRFWVFTEAEMGRIVVAFKTIVVNSSEITAHDPNAILYLPTMEFDLKAPDWDLTIMDGKRYQR